MSQRCRTVWGSAAARPLRSVHPVRVYANTRKGNTTHREHVRNTNTPTDEHCRQSGPGILRCSVALISVGVCYLSRYTWKIPVQRILLLRDRQRNKKVCMITLVSFVHQITFRAVNMTRLNVDYRLQTSNLLASENVTLNQLLQQRRCTTYFEEIIKTDYTGRDINHDSRLCAKRPTGFQNTLKWHNQSINQSQARHI